MLSYTLCKYWLKTAPSEVDMIYWNENYIAFGTPVFQMTQRMCVTLWQHSMVKGSPSAQSVVLLFVVLLCRTLNIFLNVVSAVNQSCLGPTKLILCSSGLCGLMFETHLLSDQPLCVRKKQILKNWAVIRNFEKNTTLKSIWLNFLF